MIEKVIDIQDEIKTLIHKNEETYKINPNRIISDFRGEKQTTNDYRGRQLLELLQNADDAKTNKIGIHLDTEKKILRVANNGDKFDTNGIQSLLIANLSSKHKKEFIGNKGLGFRSILNWTTEINIKTKEFVLTFSPTIAEQRFLEFIPDSAKRKDIILQNNKYLSIGEVPFAILALPEYKAGIQNQEWETVIELKYHEKYEDEIIEQLETINPRILLFLNHTNQIEISGTDELDKNIEKHFLNDDKTEIQINDKQWHIYNSGELLYPESDDKFYQFKIAWQDDLSDQDSMFFTYFPTQVRTQLPLLIHATFELNQSRNELLPGNKNQFLLKEIAKAIGEIAFTKMRNVEKSDWKAFQFLEPLNYNSNPKLNSFFEKLLELQNTLEIYPCVDGSYCILEEVVFYNNEFSNWVLRNKVEEFFPDLLMPLDNNEMPGHTFRSYTAEYWLEIMNKVTHEIISISERALLIKLLINYRFNAIRDSEIKLPLLIDNTGNVIPENKQTFMLSKEDIKQYKIPKYVDISFMSAELYDELINVLKDDIYYKRIEKEHRSRPLKRLITEVVNIGSNDITDVVRNIVVTSEEHIKRSNGEEQLEIVIGLVQSLFSIYQVNPERRSSINLEIPLLNKNLEICPGKNLFLGDDFELGRDTSIIFKEIYKDENYLVGNEFWELEEDGYGYLDNFFIWLGVNRISKTKLKRNEIHRDENDTYTRFVFNNTNWPENNSHKNYQVTEIIDFDIIVMNPNFSIENLIAWVIKDSLLSRQLEFENEDSFSYSYHNKVTPLNFKPSYIYYQIKEQYLNKHETKFIIDLDFAKELGYNSINFDHPIFKDLEINENEIIKVLNQLKISLSFNDLQPEEVFDIIHELPDIDSDGIHARKIYNLAFNYFKNLNDFDFSNVVKDYKLLAKRKGKKKYITIDEVYYSDNSTLPSKISEEFWIFDFPKRSGETQISKYFGVKTFKEVQINIDTDSLKASNASSEFQTWFLKIKPYILTYRLKSINKSIEKSEADELKKVEISLVSSLEYNIEKGEKKKLLPGEFLIKSEGKGYFLCVDNNTNLDTIKDTPEVCEAFAEILCMLFKVNDHKDDYRVIFKDRPSLKDTKYLIDVKSLNELYKQALELLGISVDEINFWKKIYKFKKLAFPNTVKDSYELSETVLKDTGFEISKEYLNVDFQNLDNDDGIYFLKNVNKALNVPLIVIFDDTSEGILNYHKRSFENTVLDFKKFFNSCLWEVLNSNPDKQKELIHYQEKYENIIFSKEIQNKLVDNRFNLEVNYVQILRDEVNRVFDFELKQDDQYQITKQPEYNEILSANNLEEEEIEDASIRSLLYFKGNIEKLKAMLAVEKEDQTETKESDSEEKLTGKLIFSSTEKIVPKPSTNSVGNRGSWNHGDKDNKRNKKAGKKAEELVYNSLMDNEDVDEVEWVSSFSHTSDKSDNKHYDIRYKPNKSANWKYLEVKSFNGSYFHLSKAEKEEAIKRGRDFEIALVMEKEIHILRDYFKEDLDFDNNNLFYATPSDYIITLKIKKVI